MLWQRGQKGREDDVGGEIPEQIQRCKEILGGVKSSTQNVLPKQPIVRCILGSVRDALQQGRQQLVANQARDALPHEQPQNELRSAGSLLRHS